MPPPSLARTDSSRSTSLRPVSAVLCRSCAPNVASSAKTMGRSCSLSLPVLIVIGWRAVAPLPWQKQIAQGTTLPPPGRGGTRHLRPLPPSGCSPMMEAVRIPPPCWMTMGVTQCPIGIGTWQRPRNWQGGAAWQAPPPPYWPPPGESWWQLWLRLRRRG
jgi:hypothetical protein